MSKIQYDSDTQTLLIPENPGVTYFIDEVPISGSIRIEEDVIVTAAPKRGKQFPEGTETEFLFEVDQQVVSSWGSPSDDL